METSVRIFISLFSAFVLAGTLILSSMYQIPYLGGFILSLLWLSIILTLISFVFFTFKHSELKDVVKETYINIGKQPLPSLIVVIAATITTATLWLTGATITAIVYAISTSIYLYIREDLFNDY